MKLSRFRQTQPHTCLPACIRIVLDYWGHQHTEEEIAKVCGTVPVWGTPPDQAVEGLTRLGYHALWFENASSERLAQLLAQDWPVIVFLRAADLPHGRAGLHAVVIAELETEHITVLDPAIGDEVKLDLQTFLRAWSALDHQGMVVWVK